MDTKYIDFETHGNVIRLYLGRGDLAEWWGDDWDDAPYEHNAGEVYDKFVVGHVDVALPFDAIVAEPCDGHLNSPWSKDDMRARRVPMLAVKLDAGETERWRYEDDFERVVAGDEKGGGVWVIRMGDPFVPSDIPYEAAIMEVEIDEAVTDEDLRSRLSRGIAYRLGQSAMMGDESIDYSSRLAWALFGRTDTDGITGTEIAKRLEAVIDGTENHDVIERLRRIEGTPSFAFSYEFCRAIFGEVDPARPIRDTDEITERLIELVGGRE